MQVINTGTTANDGTGDSLRVGGGKINANFLTLDFQKAGLLSKLALPGNFSMPTQLPNFYRNWKRRTKDLTIIVHGDSLSVRDTNNTAFPTPSRRPPICNAVNFASAVWDKFRWGKELCFRFDANGINDLPRFTESSGFVTVQPGTTASQGIDEDVWDDFRRRNGITRMYSGTGTASITFSMLDSTADKEAALDFIYRTDLNGAEVCTVSVAEGNNRLKVWDKATSEYIEANGHVFSMRHPGVSDYRGNTKFNESLKFRAVIDGFDSRNSAKTITITKTDTNNTRFMYWGIQTSTERFMVRIISSGRGSLAWPTLLPFVDDDIFDHQADLIIQEVPINGGINISGGDNHPQFYVDGLIDWVYDTDNAKSLASNSGSPVWSDTEVLIWTPHQTLAGFSNESTFSSKKFSDGWFGVADNRRWIADYIRQNQTPGVMFVDMFERWLAESMAIYGNIRDGFQTSNTTSLESFIRDGTHMNDLGVQIMAKHILESE